MAEIDAKLVMKLRSETDAGVLDCRKALTDASGDFDRAKKLLTERGLKKSEKLADRAATVGWIGSYIHTNGRVGAMVELCCNTDFVAKNDEFQGLLRDLCVGVVAFNPKWVAKENVPAEIVDEEKKKYEKDVKGKPPQIVEKILEGKLNANLYAQQCLLQMAYPKEDVFKGTYGDFIKSKIAKLGENVVVRRFQRMELGA